MITLEHLAAMHSPYFFLKTRYPLPKTSLVAHLVMDYWFLDQKLKRALLRCLTGLVLRSSRQTKLA